MSSQSILPQDRKGHVASVFEYSDSQVLTASDNADASGRSVIFEGDTIAIRLWADTEPVFFKLGTDNTVIATTSSHYLPANTEVFVSLGEKTSRNDFVSTLRVGAANVTVYLSELN